MSDETPSARASGLVAKVAGDNDFKLSTTQLDALVGAVAEDLGEAADKATIDEERLAKVESQTRVLADAVIAITETSDTLAPAVKAVIAEMAPSAPPCPECRSTRTDAIENTILSNAVPLASDYYHCAACAHSWIVQKAALTTQPSAPTNAR